MNSKKSIFWFRQDLRLSDNPALIKAAQSSQVIPVYIIDETVRRSQSASDWWLHHSLKSLDASLSGALQFFRGNPLEILSKLIGQTGADQVCWSRLYSPQEIKRDTEIKSALKERGITVISENAALLWEPWEILKDDGTPYRVFTPYFRRCRAGPFQPRKPLPAPFFEAEPIPDSLPLEELSLLPKIRWDKKLEKHWEIGERSARIKCQNFVRKRITSYKEKRDFPNLNHTSFLSPHLHFGEISPHQIWHEAMKVDASTDRDHFLSELGWREFAHLLLYHFPHTQTDSLNKKFDAFPWREDEKSLHAWQRGQTGIPIIDAGMRELWQTGVMHNRVRMIAASFLVKNLMIHWRAGEEWFYDCLVDADLANNIAGWQWVAGSGADAAPYFRIFNPVAQGERFDAEGAYVRRYVPEIKDLPNRYIHRPWEAPDDLLHTIGLTLGTVYPRPLVDLKTSRQQALDAYKSL